MHDDEQVKVNIETIVEKISSERFQQYMIESRDSPSDALRLYEWNNLFSTSLWQLLSLLEVGVRNSINDRMISRNVKLKRQTHWIYDEYSELGRHPTSSIHNKHPYTDIERAIRQVERNGKSLTPSQIISETPFGFWNQLVGKRNSFLWPDLAGAFTYAPTRDQRYISTLFTDLRDIRNRISHHHKLRAESIERGELLILELAKAVNPDFHDWIASQSKISEVMKSRPVLLKN